MVRTSVIVLFLVILVFCAVSLGVENKSAVGKGSLALADNGKAVARIVVAANPPRYTQIAALELQYYVEKISGAKLDITTDELPHAQEGYVILVGESKLTRELGYRSEDFEKDEYLVETRGQWLVLMGRDEAEYGLVTYEENGHWPGYWPESFDVHLDIYKDHGTLWAVYDFLEKYCGVRWYLLTELGEVVPSRKTITAGNIYIRRRPWAELRRFNIDGITNPWRHHYSQEGPENIHLTGRGHKGWRKLFMWMERMRFGGRRHCAMHSFLSYFDRFGKEHPEWFASGKAEFDAQMCFSNPQVVSQAAKDARDCFDGKYPQGRYPDLTRAYWIYATGDFYSIVPNDHDRFCKCRKCKDKWKPGKSQEWTFFGGRRSDYVWSFVNAVARELGKTHPDKYISALAYWQYTVPPSFPIEKNVAVMYCKSTSQYNEPRRKAFDREHLPEWRKRTRHLTVWEYYNFPRGKVFPGIEPHRIAEEMKYLHDLPIEGMFIELDSKNIAVEHLNVYCTMKMLDDPDVDIDELLAEYYRLFYGPAEEAMRTFFEKIENIYTNQDNWKPLLAEGKEHLHEMPEVSWEVMCPPMVLAEFGEIIAEAYEAVDKRQPYLDRVRLMDNSIYQFMKQSSDEYWSGTLQ